MSDSIMNDGKTKNRETEYLKCDKFWQSTLEAWNEATPLLISVQSDYCCQQLAGQHSHYNLTDLTAVPTEFSIHFNSILLSFFLVM